MQALTREYRSSQIEDDVVVRRVIAGETELFEILMRRYNQRLYRIIRSYLKDQSEVEDAMQNAYLKAFDKLHQFHGNSAFSTWLIRIGINEALLRLKQLKKGKVIDLYGPDHKAMEIPDKQINAENRMMRQEMKDLLERAIDDLPEKYRIVYVLSEIEGLSTDEICSSLALTHTNFKVRMHRAKATLKDNLLHLAGDTRVFEFGNLRCDTLVSNVMMAIRSR